MLLDGKRQGRIRQEGMREENKCVSQNIVNHK